MSFVCLDYGVERVFAVTKEDLRFLAIGQQIVCCYRIPLVVQFDRE